MNVYGERVESDMAMAYGDAFAFTEVNPFELADFAHRTGTQAAQLAREITSMSRAVLRYAPQPAASEVYVGDEREHVLRISDFVSAQAHRLMEMAPHIAKVDPNLL